jgi:hypothetical protein
MTSDDKTLLLVEDDRPLRAGASVQQAAQHCCAAVSVRPRDHQKRASAT